MNKENIECIAALLNATIITDEVNGMGPIKLDEYNGHGFTVFHLAVIRNNLAICKILEAKGELHKQSVHDQIDMYGGNTALHIASENNSIDVLRHLLQRDQIDVNSTNFCEHTAICLTQDAEVKDLLTTYGAIDDHTHDDEEFDELSDESDSEAVDADTQYTDTCRYNNNQPEEIETSLSTISLSAELIESELKLNTGLSAINLNSGSERDEVSANSLKRTEQPFGILGLTKLSAIFNQNGKWKVVANELCFHDYIERWQQKPDPTKHLIKFAEVMTLFFKRKYLLFSIEFNVCFLFSRLPGSPKPNYTQYFPK